LAERIAANHSAEGGNPADLFATFVVWWRYATPPDGDRHLERIGETPRDFRPV
jgi:hypothetical protein